VKHLQPPAQAEKRAAPTNKCSRQLLHSRCPAAADRFAPAAARHRPPELAARIPALTKQRRRLLPNRR